MNRESIVPSEKQDPTSLELFRSSITNSRERTQNEFETTANIWPACLMTDLHTTMFIFDIHAGRGKVDPAEFERIGKEMDEFVEEVRHLYGIYNSKDKVPDEEEKERLFKKFEDLGAEMLVAIKS